MDASPLFRLTEQCRCMVWRTMPDLALCNDIGSAEILSNVALTESLGPDDQLESAGRLLPCIDNRVMGPEGKEAAYPWSGMLGRVVIEYKRRFGLGYEDLAAIAELNFANARSNSLARTRGWRFAPENFCLDGDASLVWSAQSGGAGTDSFSEKLISRK